MGGGGMGDGGMGGGGMGGGGMGGNGMGGGSMGGGGGKGGGTIFCHYIKYMHLIAYFFVPVRFVGACLTSILKPFNSTIDENIRF